MVLWTRSSCRAARSSGQQLQRRGSSLGSSGRRRAASPASAREPSSWQRPERLDGAAPRRTSEQHGPFPAPVSEVTLDPDRIFVRDGEIWSSAGITAGIDLAPALVEHDLGSEVARHTAQQLVFHQRRPGGQSQFSGLVETGGRTGRFVELIEWMRAHVSEPLTVERLADRAAMSPRHFARAFTADTGTTPARPWSASGWRPPGLRSSRAPHRSSRSPSPAVLATEGACAVPSCAPLASRRRRCAAQRALSLARGFEEALAPSRDRSISPLPTNRCVNASRTSGITGPEDQKRLGLSQLTDDVIVVLLKALAVPFLVFLLASVILLPGITRSSDFRFQGLRGGATR